MGSPVGPLTPNSALSSYCTGAQMVVMYDARTLNDLLGDADGGLSNSTNITVIQTVVAASPILAELLQEYAGQIEMATSIGNRYQPADLTTLAATTTNMGSRLRRLNASGALELAWRRRPDKEMPDMPEWKENALMLEALANGELIFGFQQTMDTGIVRDYKEVASDVEARNMPSYVAQNLFGRRTNRMLPNVGG